MPFARPLLPRWSAQALSTSSICLLPLGAVSCRLEHTPSRPVWTAVRTHTVNPHHCTCPCACVHVNAACVDERGFDAACTLRQHTMFVVFSRMLSALVSWHFGAKIKICIVLQISSLLECMSIRRLHARNVCPWFLHATKMLVTHGRAQMLVH